MGVTRSFITASLVFMSCGDDHLDQTWTDTELIAIRTAEDDICAAFPDWCGMYGQMDLRRVQGPYDRSGELRFYGWAYPDTRLGLIWVDEIAIDGGIGMFRQVVTHELLHLSGCWEHHGGVGIMGDFDGPDGGITQIDVDHCNSEAARHPELEYDD